MSIQNTSFKAIILAVIIGLAALIYIQNISADTKGPEITFKSDLIKVKVGDEEALLMDVVASDDFDGDVTASLVVDHISDFDEDGTRTVTYAAYDSSNNVTKAERKIKYTDYAPPKFQLNGQTLFYASDTKVNIASLITATDMIDGDVSRFVKLTDDNIIIGKGGNYYAEVSVYNSAGDCSVLKLPVFIEAASPNSTQPAVNLTDYIIYVQKDTGSIDWKKYIDSVQNQFNSSETFDDDEHISQVDIDDSNVDLSTTGVYYVKFEYTNNKDLTGYTRLLVVVE